MREERRIEWWEDRLGVTEHGIAVAAARHEIVGRYPIGFILVERRLADLDREDAVTRGAARIRLDRQSGDLRKTAAGSGQLRKPVLERADQFGAGDVDGENAIVERQFGESPAVSGLPGG